MSNNWDHQAQHNVHLSVFSKRGKYIPMSTLSSFKEHSLELNLYIALKNELQQQDPRGLGIHSTDFESQVLRNNISRSSRISGPKIILEGWISLTAHRPFAIGYHLPYTQS